jgi:UDP-hydrolysing UDP-N-acetyl-D-glucosamine 2-epimerase
MTSVKRHIDLATLHRSEFSALKPVWRAAHRSAKIEARLVAGGSHLLARAGGSIDAVRKAGREFGTAPAAEIPFLREDDDSDAQIAAAFARAAAAFAARFAADRPDALFLIGDRWEALAIACAASVARIPIIHHSGGDVTQGSADNQTRYAISQLAHRHLTALPEHSKRLIAIGEEPWRVETVGEPSLAEIGSPPDPRGEIGLVPDAPFALATFHPSSFDTLPPKAQIQCFIESLRALDLALVITAPNADAHGGTFYRALQAFAAHTPRALMVENLGERLYHAAMAHADLMIGNSSSGIWEAPSFGLPVVNLGRRQEGRRRGANVVDAPLEREAIAQAVATARSDAFRVAARATQNPYAQADCLKRILAVLEDPTPKDKLLAKLLIDPIAQTSERA